MLYRNGELYHCECIADQNYESVQGWVEEYMDDNQFPNGILSEVGPYNGQTPEEVLHHLDFLIAPLGKYSNPGDLLILCPTKLLHRLPLHALAVDDQALIERNPVIYTQSLSMLRLCVLSAQRRDPTKPFKPLIVEALPEDAYRPPLSFAKSLKTTVLRDKPLTQLTFLAQVADTDLLHFHGHVGFHEQEPLEHFLELRYLQKVTARDIFDLRLGGGAHVTLIGCQSGRAGFSASDDLMGLSTAFHYAGASSIVSTLWKIVNHDGVEFSEAFYEALWKQVSDVANEKEKGGKVLLNLATAMREAVMKVRQNEYGSLKAPYHWAGLVLHGYWLFPCPDILEV
jgi:CHAT domain-containing protein